MRKGEEKEWWKISLVALSLSSLYLRFSLSLVLSLTLFLSRCCYFQLKMNFKLAHSACYALVFIFKVKVFVCEQHQRSDCVRHTEHTVHCLALHRFAPSVMHTSMTIGNFNWISLRFRGVVFQAHVCACHPLYFLFQFWCKHSMQQTAIESGGGKRHCRHSRTLLVRYHPLLVRSFVRCCKLRLATIHRILMKTDESLLLRVCISRVFSVARK